MKKKQSKTERKLEIIKTIIHDQQKEDGFFDGRFKLKIIPDKKKYKRKKKINLEDNQ